MRVWNRVMAAVLAVLLAVPGAGPNAGHAQEQAVVAPEVVEAVARLSETMMINDILDVLREEGIAYGATLEEDMFPGSGGAGWQAKLALIHDGATMKEAFSQALTVALAKEPAQIEEMQAFFGSELGQRVLALELAARRALLDDAAEDAAQIAWEDLQAEGGPRVAALERFAAANDLIESNVMGAMNASLAFYAGLAEGGAYDEEITEEQVLSDVWSQEEDIRRQTTEWLFPYLTLSYEPLSDEELEAYITFSETEAGQELNVALFVAFDAVFTPISRALGLAVAKQMQGQDI